VPPRLRRVLASLLLSVVSVLACLLAIEMGARAYVYLDMARARRESTGQPISRFHPLLGWDKPPYAEQRIRRDEFDFVFRVNSKGLRGPERDYAKPAGTRRVLTLGDSFAAGYYAEEDKTLRAELERRLNGGCAPSEVLSGGTIAYSTDQEYLFYRIEGRRYSPDVVLLMFYYNDLYYNASHTGPGGQPKPFFEIDGDRLVLRNAPLAPPRREDLDAQPDPPRPWRGSMALRLLSRRTLDGAPRLHAFLARLGLVQPPALDPPREYWVFGADHASEVNDMWARTRLLLRDLRDEARASGASLVLLYVPVRFEVNDEAWELTRQRYRWGRRWDRTRVVERLEALAAELQLPIVDPRAELRRAETSGRPTYYTRDVHWTADGNAVAAQAVEADVRRALGCASAPSPKP
jgi:hypothetical protein